MSNDVLAAQVVFLSVRGHTDKVADATDRPTYASATGGEDK